MGFSRQEYWSGLPFHPPRDLPHPGLKTGSPTASQTDSLPTELRGKPEDGRLAPQNNHLLGVWMPGSLIDQRQGEVRKQSKKAIILQTSPRMARLRLGIC